MSLIAEHNNLIEMAIGLIIELGTDLDDSLLDELKDLVKAKSED